MKCNKCNSKVEFTRGSNLTKHQKRKICLQHRQEQDKTMSHVEWHQSQSRWKFKHPSTIYMSGPTGSGKTTVLVELIKRGMFDLDGCLNLHLLGCWLHITAGVGSGFEG